MVFWIVQGLGICTLILFVTSLQMKTKENFLLLNIVALVLYGVQFLLSNAITGAATMLVGIIRSIIFYIYKKRNLNPSIAVLAFLLCLNSALSILAWQNMLSFFPFLGQMSNIYGQWQNDMKRLRIFSIIACVCFFIYLFYAGMYTAMLNEVFVTISSIIALWRFRSRA